VSQLGHSTKSLHEGVKWPFMANLRGCPERQNLQRELEAATHEQVAAQNARDAAHVGPIVIDDKKTLDARLTAAKEKTASKRRAIGDHDDAHCPACTEANRRSA
jgi:hypothetical protein